MFDTMGVNYALVSQLLGHASVEFTRKQYVHWFENEERDNKILEGMAQAGI
jgi:integrase